MAEQAAALLAGSGWLPEPLRTPGRELSFAGAAQDPAEQPAGAETMADGGGESAAPEEADPIVFHPEAIAAE